MFAPLSPLRFKGAIWYQGESNASEWKKYGLWQKLLVESWRRATRSPDLAFLQVQLAGYQRHTPGDRLPDNFWKDFPPDADQAWTDIRAVQEGVRSIRLCDLVSSTRSPARWSTARRASPPARSSRP